MDCNEMRMWVLGQKLKTPIHERFLWCLTRIHQLNTAQIFKRHQSLWKLYQKVWQMEESWDVRWIHVFSVEVMDVAKFDMRVEANNVMTLLLMCLWCLSGKIEITGDLIDKGTKSEFNLLLYKKPVLKPHPERYFQEYGFSPGQCLRPYG